MPTRVTAATMLLAAIVVSSDSSARCRRDADSHKRLCERCKAASDGKTCKARRGWNWRQTLEENEALTDLPGTPLVRGVDALRAPGVRVVASFNQSNWPGIVRDLAPNLVRAASDFDWEKLCSMWTKEHSYQ